MNNQKEGQKQVKSIMREMRKKEHKTIEEIAEVLGVSRQTISNWESGKSTPDAVNFMKLLKAYDPSLDNIKQLLNSETSSAKSDDREDWCRNYYGLYKRTGKCFFEKVGPTSFYVDELIKYVHDEVLDYYNNEENCHFLTDGKNINVLVAILLATPPHKLCTEIDYDLTMVELGLRLKRKGYIVNEIEDDGRISLIILDEDQRKQLDLIILEHMMEPSRRLEGLSVAERLSFNNIQAEYDQITQKLKDLKEKKIMPFCAENNFSWTQEYVLSIGYRTNNSSIRVESEAMIYTADTLEEIAKYISSIDEKVKALADNKNSFLVVSDNACRTFDFVPETDPNDVNGMKIYRINCHDEEKGGDSHGA